jgi:hypothetical protein
LHARRLNTGAFSAIPHTTPARSAVSGADTHYIVTAEEYEAQRYEAASTLFGKHTLAAYILKFTELVPRFPWSPSST